MDKRYTKTKVHERGILSRLRTAIWERWVGKKCFETHGSDPVGVDFYGGCLNCGGTGNCPECGGAPPTGYTFRRDKDGVDDVLEILDPEGKVIATIRYWDEPDTHSGPEAVRSARVICTHLNRWHTGKDTRFGTKDHVCAECKLPIDPADKKCWSSKGIVCLDCCCDRLNEQMIDDYFAQKEAQDYLDQLETEDSVGVNYLAFTNLDQPKKRQS